MRPAALPQANRPSRLSFLTPPALTPDPHPTPHPAPQKLFAPLPVVHVTAVQAKDRRTLGVYSAPVYRGRGRTGLRYIDTLSLRTAQPPSKWTLRGCAVLCSID